MARCPNKVLFSNLALSQFMGAGVGAGFTFCQDQVAVIDKFLRRLEDMSGTTSSGAEEASKSGRSVGECAASVGPGLPSPLAP